MPHEPHNTFRRTEAIQLREVEALRLRQLGLSLQQVAEQSGYATKSGAKRAIDRLLADIKFQAVDEYRQLMLAELEAVKARVLEIFYTDHVHVADGKVVRDRDGNAVLDRGPNLAAAREHRQITERIARLIGADAPVRRILEVVDVDTVDEAIRKLEAEMEAADAHAQLGPAGGSPDREAPPTAGPATPQS